MKEFFGPVALFFRVANEEEAIELANDSKYRLGGSVFTADIERGKRVASRIETGMVFVNHSNLDGAGTALRRHQKLGRLRHLHSGGIGRLQPPVPLKTPL